jgi:hypothetical protein
MKITVKKEVKYGNELYYPACEKSTIFAALAERKTLLVKDLKKIQALGYEIELMKDKIKGL